MLPRVSPPLRLPKPNEDHTEAPLPLQPVALPNGVQTTSQPGRSAQPAPRASPSSSSLPARPQPAGPLLAWPPGTDKYGRFGSYSFMSDAFLFRDPIPLVTRACLEGGPPTSEEPGRFAQDAALDSMILLFRTIHFYKDGYRCRPLYKYIGEDLGWPKDVVCISFHLLKDGRRRYLAKSVGHASIQPTNSPKLQFLAKLVDEWLAVDFRQIPFISDDDPAFTQVRSVWNRLYRTDPNRILDITEPALSMAHSNPSNPDSGVLVPQQAPTTPDAVLPTTSGHTAGNPKPTFRPDNTITAVSTSAGSSVRSSATLAARPQTGETTVSRPIYTARRTSSATISRRSVSFNAEVRHSGLVSASDHPPAVNKRPHHSSDGTHADMERPRKRVSFSIGGALDAVTGGVASASSPDPAQPLPDPPALSPILTLSSRNGPVHFQTHRKEKAPDKGAHGRCSAEANRQAPVQNCEIKREEESSAAKKLASWAITEAAVERRHAKTVALLAAIKSQVFDHLHHLRPLMQPDTSDPMLRGSLELIKIQLCALKCAVAETEEKAKAQQQLLHQGAHEDKGDA